MDLKTAKQKELSSLGVLESSWEGDQLNYVWK